MCKSSKKSNTREAKKTSHDKDKEIKRNIIDKRINYLSPIQKVLMTENNIHKNKFINSISINRRNKISRSKNSLVINSRSKSSKSNQNKNGQKINNINQNTIKKAKGKKIYNKKRYFENKSNRYISYSILLKNINNIINNSKSINNIKHDYRKQKNNKIVDRSCNKSRNINSNQINIRIIKNLNKLNNQNLKNCFRLNIKSTNL